MCVCVYIRIKRACTSSIRGPRLLHQPLDNLLVTMLDGIIHGCFAITIFDRPGCSLERLQNLHFGLSKVGVDGQKKGLWCKQQAKTVLANSASKQCYGSRWVVVANTNYRLINNLPMCIATYRLALLFPLDIHVGPVLSQKRNGLRAIVKVKVDEKSLEILLYVPLRKIVMPHRL